MKSIRIASEINNIINRVKVWHFVLGSAAVVGAVYVIRKKMKNNARNKSTLDPEKLLTPSDFLILKDATHHSVSPKFDNSPFFHSTQTAKSVGMPLLRPEDFLNYPNPCQHFSNRQDTGSQPSSDSKQLSLSHRDHDPSTAPTPSDIDIGQNNMKLQSYESNSPNSLLIRVVERLLNVRIFYRASITEINAVTISTVGNTQTRTETNHLTTSFRFYMSQDLQGMEIPELLATD